MTCANESTSLHVQYQLLSLNVFGSNEQAEQKKKKKSWRNVSDEINWIDMDDVVM